MNSCFDDLKKDVTNKYDKLYKERIKQQKQLTEYNENINKTKNNNNNVNTTMHDIERMNFNAKLIYENSEFTGLQENQIKLLCGNIIIDNPTVIEKNYKNNIIHNNYNHYNNNKIALKHFDVIKDNMQVWLFFFFFLCVLVFFHGCLCLTQFRN